MEENSRKLLEATTNIHKISMERDSKTDCDNGSVDLLAKRQKDAIDKHNGAGTSNGDGKSQEGRHAPTAILLGSSIDITDNVPPILLPRIEKIPTFTTWVFLDKNQRMPEDQSVVGRRQIYYDRNGEEALISSDSEGEETGEEEEEKKSFVETEDFILRTTIKETGLCDVTLDLLSQCLSRTPSEIMGRYEVLTANENAICHFDTGIAEDTDHPYINQDLNTAMDSFDSLFCRRCLVFDCRLHGCSQDLIFPAEKQLEWSGSDAEKGLCGPNCHRLSVRNKEKSCLSETAASLEIIHADDTTSSEKRSSKRYAENVLTIKNKKQKQIEEYKCDFDKGDLSYEKVNLTISRKPSRSDLVDIESWKPFEKALYEKGIQIFGHNSCLIVRNLMSGLKTCSEIQKCLNDSEKISREADEMALMNGDSKADDNETVGGSAQRRSRFLRRRGRVRRRLKYNWKSTGYQFRKRISQKRNEPERHYNPCGCQTVCRKACQCILNGTCCEKYCGCPKSCRNRFRGCHCAKSHCRTRQCPCFAARRECDPDVCRNCWISCGDGSTIVMPSRKVDNYECRNMKLLLRQQQRVLLGRSDVCGWGAFLKHTVAKNEFLGEYTGELVTHHEADKRGKIYDRENRSYLFNLNDQFVLDAHRKGNKLKFANHSLQPNCYAKVVMVAGDHRVGIFAKKRINGGDELFYDYRYEPDTAPVWAQNPEASGRTKKDISSGPSSSRARKHI